MQGEACPTCGSRHPDQHPAIGIFGIADPCPDPFHSPAPPEGGEPVDGRNPCAKCGGVLTPDWGERGWRCHECDAFFPDQPPEGSDTERCPENSQQNWTIYVCDCGKHATMGGDYSCLSCDSKIANPITVMPAPRGAEQERAETTEERYLHAMYDALRELDAHAEVSGDEYLGGAARPILRGVLEAANYPTPLHIDDDSELMQATREALSEHGAEGDEEPPSERWTIKHRLMPNGTDSAVVGTYTDWIEVVPASTLTEARREGEKWAAQAKQMARWWEQAEAELAEARQQLTAWQDGYPAAVARAETAERERDELAGEVERLQAESQIFRNALRTLAQKYGDTDLIEGPLARADREASALAEGSRDG
jgi:hypothetical protein